MKLYYNPASPNSRKTLATIKALNLKSVELEQVDFSKGFHKSPEFLALNPNGLLPCLVDEDTKLWESNAICSYLAGTTDSNALWPASKARYDIMRWQSWQLAHWGPACDQVTWEYFGKKIFGMGEPDEAVAKAGLEKFARFAQVLDASLEGKKFLTGDTPSLADIAVAAPLTYAAPGKLPVSDYPRIAAWAERMNAWQPWKDTAPQF